MLRKWICLVWVSAVILGGRVQASAVENAGTVQIIPQWCGTAVVGGRVSLCYVGSKLSKGYQVTDGLANWFLEEEELGESDWAKWLQHRAAAEGRQSAVIQESGAVFSDLQEGVYLIEQTDTAPEFSLFEPFLLTVPNGNAWDIIVRPNVRSLKESPRTADHPAPIIGAMGIGLSVAVLMVLVDKNKK